MRRLVSPLALIFGGALAACAPPSTALFDGPWPDERLRGADGAIDLSGFPSSTGTPLRRQNIEALEHARGFGLASATFFPFDVALDGASLPSVEGSSAADASVFLIALSGEPTRAPIDVRFAPDGGPFGGTNLLALLPFPGIPLRPGTRYAAVVSSRVRTLDGLAPQRAHFESPHHAEALARLEELGVSRASVLRLAVFTTGDPTRGLRDAAAQVLPEVQLELPAPTLTETHPGYCVFESSLTLPDYRAGVPPYANEGGAWTYAEGRLERQHERTARVFFTVPRAAPRGELGYDVGLFIRAGGGGDRPLVDRGTRDASGSSEAAAGLAVELAEAGYVGVSVDGPLGGARNTGGWDEETVLFNVLNPIAMRDNLRQAALELALVGEHLGRWRFDASACDGAAPEVSMREHAALIAHSIGATIAPLAAAVQPRFSALVLSGAGASWIRQVMHKQSPVPLRPLADQLAGYGFHHQLSEHDPLLSLLQWAGEPADPLVYAPLLADRDVLLFQGLLDTYIPPPISNPVALSLDLDLAGRALDAQLPFRGIEEDLALIGRGRIELPTPERAAHLRVVTQHREDGIEDGHEVLFQRADARAQLRMFLETRAMGAPRIGPPRRAVAESAAHAVGR